MSTTYTRAADGSFDSTGLPFDDGAIRGGIGNAWGQQLDMTGQAGDYALVMQLDDQNITTTDRFVKIEDFQFDEVTGALTIRRAAGSTANAMMWEAARDGEGAIIGHIEIEVFTGSGESYVGLTEYFLRGVSVVAHDFSVAENGAYEILTLNFVSYKVAVVEYDGLGVPVSGNGIRTYDSALSYGPAGASGIAFNPTFTGLDNPVVLTSGASFARLAPAFMSDEFSVQSATIEGQEFISIQDAVDAASDGDTIVVRNDYVQGTENVVLDVENLTFDIQDASLSINFAMDFIPGGIPVQILNIVGVGTTTIAGNSADNFVSGGSGADSIDAGNGNDIVHGNDGDDTLTDRINHGVDQLFGGMGNDTIRADYALGGETFDGGDGMDTLDVSADSGYDNVVLGGVFSQYGATFSSFEHYLGGFGIDVVQGSADGNQISGLGGNDTLNGLGGADTLDGGTGDDTLSGCDGDDLLIDTDATGVDTLSGDTDNDTLRIAFASAGETFDGGTGTDTLDLSLDARNWSGANLIWLGDAAFNAFGAALSGFENVITGSGNNEVYGSDGINVITASIGDDAINGGLGDDIIDGGDGNDYFLDENGHGIDTINGGAGNDYFRLDYVDSGEVFDGGEGADTLDLSGDASQFNIDLSAPFAQAYGAHFFNFEHVKTGNGSDVITGNDLANELDGGGGSDTVNGGGGSDTIIDQDPGRHRPDRRWRGG